MAASASNYSFASGVSSVSSATSASSSASSVKSFNFDALSSFQGGNLISTSQLKRTVVRDCQTLRQGIRQPNCDFGILYVFLSIAPTELLSGLLVE